MRMTCLALLCVLAGCGKPFSGYSDQNLFDESIRTVAVPIFKNRSFERNLEIQLTEAMIKEIEAATPFRVTGGAAADTIIEGSILSVERRLISRDFQTAFPQEVQLIVTVSFEWKDLRDGKVLRKRGRLEGVGHYQPGAAVNQPVEVARHAVVAQLSRELVGLMRKDW